MWAVSLKLMKKDKSPYDFYGKIIDILIRSKIPFAVGGGFAVFEYSKYNRPTNDLDIFCKGGDFPKIVTTLKEKGVKIKVLDERWLAKALGEKAYVDIIFSSPNYVITVDDTWFQNGSEIKLFGHKVKIIPKEELIWCKAFIQDRNRFDGADINHIILISGKNLDWKRLLFRMENYWEVLLSFIINFRFIYPSERDIIPAWLLNELLSRLDYQIKNPTPVDKVCRGPLLSRTQYKIDINKLGFEAIF